MEVKDFQKEVLEKSKEIPVVVDFWAPWCGPCRFLGPVIEELADEANDKWILAKVNTDEHPELMQKYHIQGIPAVKLFVDGVVAAEFTGVLPKHSIEKWLEEYLPDERKEAFGKIKDRFLNHRNGLNELEDFVNKNPDMVEPKVLLAKELVFNDPLKALELIKDINPGNEFYEQSQSVKDLIALLNCKTDQDGEIGNKVSKAVQAVRNKDMDTALANLINAVSLDKSYCEEIPRKASIAIFNLLGREHELTKKYRRQFDMALY